MGDALKPCPRNEASLIAIAAWCNVPVDQLPERFRLHTCEATMIAWQRVTNALMVWNTRATDAAIATDLSSPVVRAAFIIAAPTLAAVLGIEETMR